MLLDRENLLSNNQDLAQAAGNYLSTNTIDLGAAGTPAIGGSVIHDIGRGNHVEVLVQVTETFTSGGAATVKAQLVMADNAALTSNLTILDQTDDLALATLVAGYQFRLRCVPQGVTKRYLGVRYVIGTATTTAGKCTAGIVLDRQTNPTV
jgi:hypothetical protein